MKKIFFFFLFARFLFSQISFSFLLEDTLQDGQYPSAVIDTNGNIRFIYYNAYEDKLFSGTYYVQGDSVGELRAVNPSLQGGYGYPSALFKNKNGKIFCAYMQNVNGRMRPCFAGQLPDGSWQNEIVGNTTYGQYGTVYRYQPLWTQASISLFVDSTETYKIISFFSGFFDLATFSYDMKLYLASYDGTNWNVGKTPYTPVWDPGNPDVIAQEGINGERLGEFCNVLQERGDTFSVFCSGAINGNLVKVTGRYGKPLQWQYSYTDSVLRINAGLTDLQRRNASFQGISVFRKDTITHLVYSVGTRTGSPTIVPSDLFSVSYKKILGDSVLISSFIVPPGTNEFVLFPSIFPYSADTLFSVYSNLSRKQYFFAYSSDSGKTWTKYPVFSTNFPDHKNALLLQDSLIFIFIYDDENEQLVLLRKNINTLSDTLWNIRPLTNTSYYGEEIAADFYLENNEPKFLSVFTERVSGGLFLRHNSRFFSMDLPNTFYYTPAVYVVDSLNYYVAYTDGSSNFLKLSSVINGNSPVIEVVDFSASGFAPSLERYNGNLYVAFASTDGVKVAWKTGATWNYEHIDSAGIYPRLFVYKNDLHCLYYVSDSAALLLARRQGGTWTKTRISDSLINVTPNAYDGFVRNDTLHISFRSDLNVIYYVYEENGGWRNFAVNIPEQAVVGTKISIVADEMQSPWIIYSVQDDQTRIGITTFKDSTWYFVTTSLSIRPDFSVGMLGDNLFIISKYRRDSLSAMVLGNLDSLSAYVSGGVSGIFTGRFPMIRIYPNPAETYIVLRSGTVFEELKIYDILGKEMPFVRDGERLLFSLPSGLYFLRGRTDEGLVWTKKFLVK